MDSPLVQSSAPPLGEAPIRTLGRNDFHLLGWLVLGYVALIAFGFAALRIPAAMPVGNRLNVDRSAFVAVNAATLTGFQQNVGVGQFKSDNPLGPLVLLALTLGGSLFALFAGGLGAVRVLRLPYSNGQVATAAVVALALATLGGTAALLSHDRRLLEAVLLAASSFGNSGVYVGRLGDTASPATHLVLMPLALLGGLGLPVLMELWDLATLRRPLSRHSRTVLKWSAGLYLGATLVLLLIRPNVWTELAAGIRGGGWTPRQAAVLHGALVSSATLSINARTCGLPVEYAGVLPRMAQWVVVLLMLIGANPGGAGGGVKITTLLTLGGGVKNALSGRRIARAVGIAAVWLACYLLIAGASFLLLLWQVPQLPADQLLFLSISATSNAGLSHDTLSLVLSGLYTLSAVMLLGRLAPILVLWWMAATTRDAELAVG